MVTKPSVVTPERFKQGLSFQDYLAQVKVNKDRFEQYYGTAKDALTPADVEFFKRAIQKGAGRVAVIGEDWCPDVYRGMPVIARIAEASGMEMRVFPRDANLDIMNEFLNKGEFQSIPTVVFYTGKQEYLFHWIERPKQGYAEITQITEQLKREMPGADDKEVGRVRRERLNARYPDWQKFTVQEIREMLKEKLGL